MAREDRCPKCGAKLGAGAPEGLCPRCLMKAGLGAGADATTEGAGMTIGRYKLLELIGEGGFGVVYMAQQEEPIRRRVALKIIKLGMDTKQVIARFEAERQALAMMEHPNIAKVLDAGATDTGRPYFVMELVKGIPITEYCDKNNLDTRQRLELFIEVCRAVQHAHQKGIIHRDIKPTNVMITQRDGTPVPKIIDFGIAKATQARLTEKTLFTEYHQFIGTPEYMSPEQAEMGELDIDTRSDIYSLGVLLYELLTGGTPLDGERLRSSAYDEMLKTIRETEPPKPSTRLNTLGDALSDVARHRHVEPSELCRLLTGDLDWVVMKALEKDRTRRYETANELAQDVERHLRDEPVVAGPPGAVYRLRKFIRRNRALVTSVAVVLVVLMAGIVASTIFAVGQARARAEAERQVKIAQAVADFLENDVLASVEPARAKGPEVTVRYILDKASESMGDKFEDEPLVEASIHQTLGSTYMSIGKFDVGESHLKRALEIRREQLGAEHTDTLDSMHDLGSYYTFWARGRLDEAEALLVQAGEIRRHILGSEHPDTLKSMFSRGWVYHNQDRFDKAEPLLVKALEGQRRVLGQEHPDTLKSMFWLGWAYFWVQRRYDKAEPLLVKALEGQRRVLGQEHPDTLRSAGALGELYQAQGRDDEAAHLLAEMVEASRRVLGDEHPHTLDFMTDLCFLYRAQGRYDEAMSIRTKFIELDPNNWDHLANRADIHLDMEQWDKAIADLSKAIELASADASGPESRPGLDHV
ncbi:MAG: tetratricopeptide repeat protein, partial [Planctomycetota bacterium]